jgi:dUTP pyrophosphatase
MNAVLSKSDIKQLLEQKPPLVEGYINLGEQLQPNGFELTLRDIARFQNAGQIGAENKTRRLPDLAPLLFANDGFMDIISGSYLITYNEIVHLPNNMMALGRPRSSLLRCGVTIGTAVWDAGYEGRSQSLMVVYNTQGFRVQKNARVMQLVFFRLTSETDGYTGTYQGENIR